MLRIFSKNNKSIPTYLAWTWALGLVFIPLTYVVFISFMSRGLYGGVVTVPALSNYLKLFEPGIGSLIGQAVLRSVLMAFGTTVLCLICGFPLALFLVFKAGKYRDLLFFLLIIPFWTQFLIRVYAWMTLLSDNGVISQIFGVPLLFTYKAVFMGMLYNYLPYMTMSLYVSLEKLDVNLLEAAADLGASGFKTFKEVILPLASPGILAGSIMVFIPALGEFVIPDVLGGGKKFFIGNLLAQQFLSARDWPFGAALSVVLILVVALSFYIFNLLGKNSKKENLYDALL